MSTKAGSEEVFLLRFPKTCLSGDGFCEGHLTQGNKEVLNTTPGVLPWREAQVKSQNEMKNQSQPDVSHFQL